MKAVRVPDEAAAALGAVSRGEGVAVWRQIADAVGHDIASGELRPGARLPTEEVLTARFGVNRHTVRRALASLADQGLVRSARGSGTFVAGPITYPIAARTRFSEIIAGAGRDPGGEMLGARAERAEGAEATALALPVGAPVLVLDTVRSADGLPLSVARSVFPLPRFAGLDEALGKGETLSDALARYGSGDYRRLETRLTARQATAAEAHSLQLAAGRIVIVAESVNVDRHDVPIQATRSSFAADRVEFLIES